MADAQAPSVGSTNAQSIQACSRALNDFFDDYWQDYLRRNPEQARALGDKRFNDRWSDLSAEERPSMFPRRKWRDGSSH
jgi:hypothetical protein